MLHSFFLVISLAQTQTLAKFRVTGLGNFTELLQAPTLVNWKGLRTHLLSWWELTCYHDGPGVPPETVFEEPGQNWVSVRNEGFLLMLVCRDIRWKIFKNLHWCSIHNHFVKVFNNMVNIFKWLQFIAWINHFHILNILRCFMIWRQHKFINVHSSYWIENKC